MADIDFDDVCEFTNGAYEGHVCDDEDSTLFQCFACNRVVCAAGCSDVSRLGKLKRCDVCAEAHMIPLGCIGHIPQGFHVTDAGWHHGNYFITRMIGHVLAARHFDTEDFAHITAVASWAQSLIADEREEICAAELEAINNANWRSYLPDLVS
jgi:hypothetical protein